MFPDSLKSFLLTYTLTFRDNQKTSRHTTSHLIFYYILFFQIFQLKTGFAIGKPGLSPKKITYYLLAIAFNGD